MVGSRVYPPLILRTSSEQSEAAKAELVFICRGFIAAVALTVTLTWSWSWVLVLSLQWSILDVLNPSWSLARNRASIMPGCLKSQPLFQARPIAIL